MSATGFSATHRVPHGGLPAYATADPRSQPVTTLAADTAVQVVEETGAWARVVVATGWTGWVDGRRLDALPAATPPSTREPVPDVHTIPAAPPRLTVGGVRIGLPLVGAVLLVVSAIQPWVAGAGTHNDAFDVRLRFLADGKQTESGPVLGGVLLVLGVIAVAVALRRLPGAVARAVGVAAIGIATAYLVQLQRLLGSPESGRSLLTLGTGTYLCAAAGLLLVLGRQRSDA